MESAAQLIEKLNTTDECSNVEAKRGSAIDRSIMETVCAFSNEPGLGGGYILLGVEKIESETGPRYEPSGIADPDKIQSDLASQCASTFNTVVRPDIESEVVNGQTVIKVFVPELPAGQKPLFFQKTRLPAGAFRRIGPTDQACTEDDMGLFYNDVQDFDSSIVRGSSLSDIDPEAVALYRQLREKVDPEAIELTYNDTDLLHSLLCIEKEQGEWRLTYTGLLVFGTKVAHRRLIPAVRVDYIRVPGNEWVEDPENRFTNTIDMRGALLPMVSRIYAAVADDLPKGFLLPEGRLQAEASGLPGRVLREALVNALIHRSYRVHQPIQVIRYGNRIEIRNPGFSLKSVDQLGQPGSWLRNPHIAPIFHETRLAETKGSGFRTMQQLMTEAGMAPPTFESDRGTNTCALRLLLHHFWDEEDIKWLTLFERFNLNDNQKRALIFIREVGAIDNLAYRQINGCDGARASRELRQLRDFDLFEQKNSGRTTYYKSGPALGLLSAKATSQATVKALLMTTDASGQVNLPVPETGVNGPVPVPESGLIGPVPDVIGPVTGDSGLPPDVSGPVQPGLLDQLPDDLKNRVSRLGRRTQNAGIIRGLILELCQLRPYSLDELSRLLQRKDKYLLEEFIGPLRQLGYLQFTYPEMPNHPNQAYRTIKLIDQNDSL